jgi:hypothetical protein
MAPFLVLFAHFQGFGELEIIKIVLLASAAQAPLMLLANESLAASCIKRNHRVPSSAIAYLLIAQFITVLVSVWVAIPSSTFGATVFMAAVLCTWATYVSVMLAQRFIFAAVGNAVSARQSLLIGIVPSGSSLVLYVIYALFPQDWMQAMFWLQLILPALLQAWLLRRLPLPPHGQGGTFGINACVLTLAPLALIVMSVASTSAKFGISNNYPGWASVVIAMLNALSSVAVAVGKASFLEAASQQSKRYWAEGVTVLGLFVVVLAWAGMPLAPAMMFVATNAGIVAALSWARHSLLKAV